MGGQEGSRGFLYQGIASVIEALNDKSWDKIYIEFNSKDDKVDIALEKNTKIYKAIQVKSTINSFSKSSLQTWIKDLVADDVGANEIEIFMIGQCANNAITFVNSIDKFYKNNMDATAKNSLKGFDTNLLNGKQLSFVILPYDVNNLQQILISALHKYTSQHEILMTYDKLDFIASTLVNDQMISSISGKGIERNDFDERLNRLISLIIGSYTPKRKTLGIKSFSRGAEHMENEAECHLSLIDMFSGRDLKSEYNWNTDIYENVVEFLTKNTSSKEAYQIYLDTHLSIAFFVGRTFDSKSGVNIYPIQKVFGKGTLLWDVDYPPKKEYTNLEITHLQMDENQSDSALILNITRDIYDDVINYIKENDISIGRIINCFPETGSANFAIEDGTHALNLANSVYRAVAQRTTLERKAKLHIFASTPNAFMFFLGQFSRGMGKCVLYEYGFDATDSQTYTPSIEFET